MPLSPEQLADAAERLAKRPGHEAVRFEVARLLIDGLGARPDDVRFEQPLPEVRGRVDALVGRTVFEFKSDLRRERADAESQLARYLADREAATGERYVGVAADGADFRSYELRDGALAPFSDHRVSPERAREMLLWLNSAVSPAENVEPDPGVVRALLGRESHAWLRALRDMRRMYAAVSRDPEARTKRALWSQLLAQVYGSPVDDDDLFFQHTYLTALAKAMAAQMLGLSNTALPDLLSGQVFEQADLFGVAESDFFDWPLQADGGAQMIERLVLQVGAFRLADVQADVLKGLYESLIDPEQRHVLGEYYTPDWLAESICATAVRDPLTERVVDPACGSGAFLFHAVRRCLDAARAAGLTNAAAIERCCDRVLGVDVHPVAVQIARVTYLLAIGQRLREDRGEISIPVYLGDSLQWNTEPFLADRDVLIAAPADDVTGAKGETLHFPAAVARDPALFDRVINRMLQMSANSPPQPAEGLKAWLVREGLTDAPTQNALVETYERLVSLREQGRDHIWGFVARNLVRPVWLSQQEQRPDVLVGNPPWLAYRYMDDAMQARFRAECAELTLWAGGNVATHQDISAYFYARCAEMYLRPHGRAAFVMPYAAMSRSAFEGFRRGAYPRPANGGAKNGGRKRANGPSTLTTLRFTEAWALPDAVQPLFPVPSCVLFAERGATPSGVGGATVWEAAGRLPRRDASTAEANRTLAWFPTNWPQTVESAASGSSAYRGVFRQGATLVPRILSVVERPYSPVGVNINAPLLRSRRTPQERAPWKNLDPLTGNVEREFLRPLYLGESIAPFRPLEPLEAVIPWNEERGLMDASKAALNGYGDLAGWMRRAEALWERHKQSPMALVGRWNYHGELTVQLPPLQLRVVYAASGTWPAAAVISDAEGVVDSSLYWAAVETPDEARYLTAVLNSETARALTAPRQSRGQWGARHFSKTMLTLPIPRFDAQEPLHLELAALAAGAERVAANVPIEQKDTFITTRRNIRGALAADGVAERINARVAQLLGQPAP